MKFHLHIFLAIMLQSSFAITLKNTHGVYNYSRSKNSSRKIIIKGKLIDKETGGILQIASVKINNKIVTSDTNGFFSSEVVPGKYILKGLCYPYCSVSTKPIRVSTGEMIIVRFLLVIDKSPIID